MPFMNALRNPFSPKKSTPRKAKIPHSLESCPNRQKELGLEIPAITIKLGGVVSKFLDGEWKNNIPSEKKAGEEIVQLRIVNEKLEKENNLNRIKVEILINTVASHKIKIQRMEAELKQLRGIVSKSPVRFNES